MSVFSAFYTLKDIWWAGNKQCGYACMHVSKGYQQYELCCCTYIYIVWWLCNHREVKHYGGVPYKWDRFAQKMMSIWKCFRPSHSERFACCTLTIQYIICSTVGQSIASISDLGKHIYLGASCLDKYDASVTYIGYRPPYRTMYITYGHTLEPGSTKQCIW